jgi:hypothetical protein
MVATSAIMDQTPPKPTPKDQREARLAQALRENLRRRKAPKPTEPPKPAPKANGD